MYTQITFNIYSNFNIYLHFLHPDSAKIAGSTSNVKYYIGRKIVAYLPGYIWKYIYRLNIHI